MRGSTLTDAEIEFVFGNEDDDLREELRLFWLNHQIIYKAEISSSSPETPKGNPTWQPGPEGALRQTGAIAREPSGAITAIVFVVLRAIDPSLGLGTHAYFVRMYNRLSTRKARLANQLFETFLDCFDQASGFRDHRASVLIAEAISPRLRRPSMRRYFVRHGFRLQGSNKRGSEIWTRRLVTRFIF